MPGISVSDGKNVAWPDSDQQKAAAAAAAETQKDSDEDSIDGFHSWASTPKLKKKPKEEKRFWSGCVFSHP